MSENNHAPDLDLNALYLLASSATPGPWFQVGHPWNPKGDFVCAGAEDPHIGTYVCDTEDFDGEVENSYENAAFIAAANPKTIVEILYRLRLVTQQRDDLIANAKLINEQFIAIAKQRDELLAALRITRGNVASLGPAGAINPYTPYREWLAMIDSAIAAAESNVQPEKPAETEKPAIVFYPAGSLGEEVAP